MKADQLQVVCPQGRTLDFVEKLKAHEGKGLLHRAVSVFLFDSTGRLLIQRRAQSKYHFAGYWANSCCTHPLGSETPQDAALRAAMKELGIAPTLQEVGVCVYEAKDAASGLVEREYDHIFEGRLDSEIHPHPLEIAETRVVSPRVLVEMQQEGSRLSPWLLAILAWAGHEHPSQLGGFSAAFLALSSE